MSHESVGPRAGRTRALAVAAFPVLLTVGIALIPVVSDYADHELAVRAVRERPCLWVWGHLIAAAAFGLNALATVSIAGSLPERARRACTRIATVLMAPGVALHAAGLGADGIGPVAALRGGGDVGAFFEGSAALVPAVFVLGAVLFGAGQIALVLAVRRERLLPGPQGGLVVPAAILFSACEALPTGWGLYGVAAASLAIHLPIARALWRAAPGSADRAQVTPRP